MLANRLHTHTSQLHLTKGPWVFHLKDLWGEALLSLLDEKKSISNIGPQNIPYWNTYKLDYGYDKHINLAYYTIEW